MDLASFKKYACFGDGFMCAVIDRPDTVQRYVKLEDIRELLKQADNSAMVLCPRCLPDKQCDLGFGGACGIEPCRLAQHQ